ncbi:MAG: leucine-rich repeat protein [Bacteroidales bacterium]|nr:leucine-rich repeat protein [Bacteroidales bacterium]
MAAIQNINEPWNGHTGLEVETFLKSQITAAIAAAGGKIGYVDFANMTMRFWEYEGAAQPLVTIGLGGTVYTVNVDVDLGTFFYILQDETSKVLTITPTTMQSSFGSDESEPFTEDYVYTVAVNTGNGYVDRTPAEHSIHTGESASFDIRPFINTGDNYIRISVTGTTSGQTKTIVCTATLTSLSLTVNHAWQEVWNENSPYVLNGIRFSGNLVKTLHVALDGTELNAVEYGANESYTSTATTYTIPASAFPASSGNGVHTVTMWMTAQGVSTPVTTYRIMCAASGDTTPMIAVNSLGTAVNFTSSTIFSYAVFNADSARFSLSASIGGETFAVTKAPVENTNLEEGRQYTFAYTIEVDTGNVIETMGTLSVDATPYDGNTPGSTLSVTTPFDNTYSYVATPGALFHLNAATRSNNTSDYLTIINEAGASQDGNFAASYAAVWSGFSYKGDGWEADGQSRALIVPAGSSLSVTGLEPLKLLSSYATGMTVEMMIKCAYPSDYSQPVFSMWAGNKGIRIYPTKIVVFSSLETDETTQSVMLAENRVTHLCITWVKNYGDVPGRNLCSIYVNGISNVNFAFQGLSTFGENGSNLVIGQQDTDAYLYRMRVYGTALSSQAVFNNFLNCITDGIEFNRREEDAANNVYYGNAPGYAETKAAGYNIMVVEMADDTQYLPSIDHPAPKDGYSGCSFSFEYADHPEWNVKVGGISLDGQGTTSKQYYRWNLRGKTKKTTTWTYADGTVVTGKTGKFAGDDYAIIDRITAKKNYASSQQGHKMGMTGLYNDLFKRVGLGSHLPDEDYCVAVYQFPFVGFRHYTANDSYEYIGLYTAGPDKGSKVTFGYVDDYPNLMSIEGPNHDPAGTRFITPWVDVTYSPADETSMIGGLEAWDADYMPYETSDEGTQSDWDNILALYNAEWAPAYEIVYNCSPYIAAISETGYASIAAINADIQNFRDGSTNGVKNSLLSLYSTASGEKYELYFYRIKTGQYEKLATVDSTKEHNILTPVTTYLSALGYSTTSPTTAQLIEARAARFKVVAPDYWDIDQTVFHYAYCILFGVTDNFAKNSYPFKFRGFNESLASGESIYCKRWGWRQDDLDTVLATDNNGRSTKPYYVEHGDQNASGNEIFQGGDSALWVLIRDNYVSEVSDMMLRIANAASAISSDLILGGDGLHETLFNVVSYYCWEHSAKYFAPALYETDREWSYIAPWLEDDGKQYNGVFPLDQALGDQYQAERLWVERRIAYIFSKYRIGAFNGTTGGYNMLANTLGAPFTFEITPAINLYPVLSVAATNYVDDSLVPASSSTVASPVEAGDSFDVSLPAGGASNNYIHGMDWIASLGDLCGMKLTDRAADTNISFTVQSARLQTLKVGDPTASNVIFNATSFAVSSPSLTYLDARNTTTVKNVVNLLACPRLRTVLFAGSGAMGLYLPQGAKLTEVSFPSAASVVYMDSLPLLTNENLTLPTLSGITSLCVSNCVNIDPIELVSSILAATGENLQYATIQWDGIKQVGRSALADLAELTTRAGYVQNTGTTIANVAGTPIIEGTLELTELAPASEYFAVMEAGLDVTNADDMVYIDFADEAVEAIAIANWDTNGNEVISFGEARAVTNLVYLFRNNTEIETFNELKYFTGLTYIHGVGNSASGAFSGCTALREVSLPATVTTIQPYAFYNDAQLTSVGDMSHLVLIDTSSFRGSGIAGELDLSNVTTVNSYAFSGCTGITSVNLPSVTTLAGTVSGNSGAFENCTSLESVVLNDGLTEIQQRAFYGCTALSSINIPTALKEIGQFCFMNCSSLGIEVYAPNLETMSDSAFCRSGVARVTSLGSLITIPGGNGGNSGAFRECPSLTEVYLPSSLTSIGQAAFYMCPLLTSIHWAGRITSIGASAFAGCSSLSGDVELPYLGSLGTQAFRDTAIVKVLSLGSITSIVGGVGSNDGVFRRCTSLKEIHFPSTLTSIGQATFANCTSLETVEWGANITSIATQAFISTGPIDDVNIPELTSLGDQAFRESGVKKVTSLGKITTIAGSNSIYGGVFRNCTSLTEVYLPSTLTTIQIYAFQGCTSLTTVHWNSALSTIGNQSFGGCSALTGDINLPNLTSIDDAAFRNCSNLTSVSNLGSITTLTGTNSTVGGCFRGCSRIKLIHLPSTLTSIGYYAMSGCSSLEAIIIDATTPPSLQTSALNSTNNCPIYVPDASVATYKAATGWSGFASRIFSINDYNPS